MQALKCCIVKLGSFNLTIYYSIQKWKFFGWAWLLFNITTILSKKDQNYFEVMINSIRAVTLHARTDNVRSLVCVLVNFIMDDINLVMNSYLIDSLFRFTLELKLFASSRVCLICTCPSFALAMMFLHSFLCKSR